MKTKLNASALCLVMLLSSLLTGCVGASSAHKESLQIYQARALFLEAGQPILTKAGIYTPQVDEVWHSAASYNDLENQLLNTAAALAQERNRSVNR